MKYLLVLVAFCSTLTVLGQETFLQKLGSRITGAEIKVRKTGPYIGIQQGKYMPFEFGVERQYQRVRLLKPEINAFHTGVNYNIKQNVLGYDLGYWRQKGRLGITYGANVVMRTDFDSYQFGVAPVIGFKLLQFHLQTGYNFLTPKAEIATNTLFISLRYVFVNERKFEMNNFKTNDQNNSNQTKANSKTLSPKAAAKAEKAAQKQKEADRREKLRKQAEKEREKLR